MKAKAETINDWVFLIQVVSILCISASSLSMYYSVIAVILLIVSALLMFPLRMKIQELEKNTARMQNILEDSRVMEAQQDKCIEEAVQIFEAMKGKHVRTQRKG
jgi:hypothetical protein